MSCVEDLAKAYAIKMLFIDKDDQATAKSYDKIQSLLELNIIPDQLSNEYSRYSPHLVKTMLEINCQLFRDLLEQYGDAVKKGMVVTSITGDLLSDARKVNIDQLASIGKNTAQPQSILGKRFDFNHETLTWDSGCRSYDFDRTTGLPILSKNKQNCS